MGKGKKRKNNKRLDEFSQSVSSPSVMASPNLPACLKPTPQDVEMLISAQCHLGSKNLQVRMEPYLWETRRDGLHIINIGKTWEKLVLAARIIATIDNPADICAVSARAYGRRAVLKFAAYTGAKAIDGRFTPGSFTNHITRSFAEPRLLLATDPRTDALAIREASYANIPVIALCDTDSPLQYVDVAVPTNNKGRHAVGLIWWMLTREVLRVRGVLAARDAPWDVVVDLYFFHDPETENEINRRRADQQAIKEAEAAAAPDWVASVDDAVPAGAAQTHGGDGTADWAETPGAPVSW